MSLSNVGYREGSSSDDEDIFTNDEDVHVPAKKEEVKNFCRDLSNFVDWSQSPKIADTLSDKMFEPHVFRISPAKCSYIPVCDFIPLEPPMSYLLETLLKLEVEYRFNSS